MMTDIFFGRRRNIHYSLMAEFVLKELVKKTGLDTQFQIESAASIEEIGNPVYPLARRKLTEHGHRLHWKIA